MKKRKERPTLADLKNKIHGEKGLVRYRGFKVRLYDDDYGEQVYFFFKGSEYSCGAFNMCYVDDVHFIIDNYLDNITYTTMTLQDKVYDISIKWRYNELTGNRECIAKCRNITNVIEYTKNLNELRRRARDSVSISMELENKIKAETILENDDRIDTLIEKYLKSHDDLSVENLIADAICSSVNNEITKEKVLKNVKNLLNKIKK